MSIHTKKSGARPVDMISTPIGGRYVNNLFEEHLSGSIGSQGRQFLNKCKVKHLGAWLDMLQEFEDGRKAIQFDKETSIIMDVSYTFFDAYSQLTGKNLSDEMDQNENSKSMTVNFSQHGKLIVSGVLTKACFTNAMDRISEDIKTLLKKHGDSYEYCGLLLTGGFGESDFAHAYLSNLQRHHELDAVKLYTPQNSTPLIMTGTIISSKICQKLGHHIAVLYTSMTTLKSKDGELKRVAEGKLFPLLIQGQRIVIGEHLCYGPLDYVYVDQNHTVSVEVVYISEISGAEAIKLVGPQIYYNPSKFKDRDSMGKLELHIPLEGIDKLQQLWLEVWCDCYGFKMKMSMDVGGERKSASGYYFYKRTKRGKRYALINHP